VAVAAGRSPAADVDVRLTAGRADPAVGYQTAAAGARRWPRVDAAEPSDKSCLLYELRYALAMQTITTFLMFEGAAEEAMTFYVGLFDDAKLLDVTRYGPDGPGREGTVVQATFQLAGQKYMCIDSHVHHEFGFTPAMSLFVNCDGEDELDRLYAALAEGGTPRMPLGDYGFSRKFGWTDDRFGVSWQLNLP
jgi:predicted 3-demethylubiquinone-9 3-methyltransferase (glyoxalase superfamily)